MFSEKGDTLFLCYKTSIIEEGNSIVFYACPNFIILTVILIMRNKIHFHSIDALRFFAFFKVYLLHLPLQGDFPIFAYLKQGGGIGVAFFFVLSGFLITYLLCHEKNTTGKIDPKRFFIRRCLRIWPLFFLVVIITYLLPFNFKQHYGMHMIGGGYELDWRYSFTFLENYKMLLEDNYPKTSPLSVFWSLCIEEHFYISWLIIFYLLPFKHIFKALCACVLISWLARYLDPFIFNNQVIVTNDLFTNLDYFAIGGMLGYAIEAQNKLLSTISSKLSARIKRLFAFFVLLFVLFMKEVLPFGTGTIFDVFSPTILAAIFMMLVAVFTMSANTFVIRNKLLNYLGNISYGLYIFHILVIHISFQYLINKGIKLDDWRVLSAYILFTLGVSILMAMLSFEFFENYFLRVRERWNKK